MIARYRGRSDVDGQRRVVVAEERQLVLQRPEGRPVCRGQRRCPLVRAGRVDRVAGAGRSLGG